MPCPKLINFLKDTRSLQTCEMENKIFKNGIIGVESVAYAIASVLGKLTNEIFYNKIVCNESYIFNSLF